MPNLSPYRKNLSNKASDYLDRYNQSRQKKATVILNPLKEQLRTQVKRKSMGLLEWKKLGNKAPSIPNLGIKLQQKGNFHTNFVDLNPEWANKRHERAVKMANKMLDRIKISVGGDYKKKHMTIFRKDVTAGKRISYTELRNLQGDYKDIYKTVIKQKDREINAYIDDAI